MEFGKYTKYVLNKYQRLCMWARGVDFASVKRLFYFGIIPIVVFFCFSIFFVFFYFSIFFNLISWNTPSLHCCKIVLYAF